MEALRRGLLTASLDKEGLRRLSLLNHPQNIHQLVAGDVGEGHQPAQGCCVCTRYCCSSQPRPLVSTGAARCRVGAAPGATSGAARGVPPQHPAGAATWRRAPGRACQSAAAGHYTPLLHRHVKFQGIEHTFRTSAVATGLCGGEQVIRRAIWLPPQQRK